LESWLIAQSSNSVIVKLEISIVFWLFQEDNTAKTIIISSNNNNFLIDGSNWRERRKLL
jgi:hypothetical protein